MERSSTQQAWQLLTFSFVGAVKDTAIEIGIMHRVKANLTAALGRHHLRVFSTEPKFSSRSSLRAQCERFYLQFEQPLCGVQRDDSTGMRPQIRVMLCSQLIQLRSLLGHHHIKMPAVVDENKGRIFICWCEKTSPKCLERKCLSYVQQGPNINIQYICVLLPYSLWIKHVYLILQGSRP